MITESEEVNMFNKYLKSTDIDINMKWDYKNWVLGMPSKIQISYTLHLSKPLDRFLYLPFTYPSDVGNFYTSKAQSFDNEKE